jgi:hypothetical protein
MLDVYVAVADLGLYDHWTSRQPHYQAHRRYSDCRTLRLNLLSTIVGAHHDQPC